MRRGRLKAHGQGLTLIEVMISLSILLVGLLGMMHLQVWGLSSNQGARAHTQAMQIARDVAAGLQRLPITDSRLSKTTLFGSLIQSDGTVPGSGYTSFTSLPSVQATVPNEFERRWTVLDAASDASGNPTTKIIAVSVVYRERVLPQPREVVLYIQQSNRKLIAANAGAYR